MNYTFGVMLSCFVTFEKKHTVAVSFLGVGSGLGLGLGAVGSGQWGVGSGEWLVMYTHSPLPTPHYVGPIAEEKILKMPIRAL